MAMATLFRCVSWTLVPPRGTKVRRSQRHPRERQELPAEPRNRPNGCAPDPPLCLQIVSVRGAEGARAAIAGGSGCRCRQTSAASVRLLTDSLSKIRVI